MEVINRIAYVDGHVSNEILYVTGNVINSVLYVESESLMYKTRMLEYYPKVIRDILEFQAIIDAEYPEFDLLETANDKIVTDAYLFTMSEDRVAEWERILGIRPLEDSTVDDRRDTVIARIRGQGKLNTELINTIVGTFTGGTANSWIKNGTLYVVITPPPNNKQYRFENVEQELSKKIPAHLGFAVSRNYYTWGDIKNDYATWGDLNSTVDKWESVLLFVPFN